MTGRRKIGLFLVVAGVALLAASGILYRKSAPALAQIAAGKATFEDSLKRVHEHLVQTSLKARGLQESESQIPDTLKVYGAGKMMELSNSYNKTIRKLEMTERDINLEISSLKRDAERERAASKARTLPVAGGGAAVLLLGLILTALPNRRVGA
jgi:hypothetical protein